MKCTLLTILLFLAGGLSLYAPPPAWWSDPSTKVVDSQADEEHYAPANLGQLKHVAKQAKTYFDTTLPGGAGTPINSVVDHFEPREGQGYTQTEVDDFIADNYSPINLGQLKAVAKPFYDRLLQMGYDTKANLIARGYPQNWAHNYPWDPQTPKSENYAPANLGQLKMVFSFDLLDDRDSPANGLPDWWERHYFSQTGLPSNGLAPRGDGLTYLQAYQQGRDPIDFYDGAAPQLVLHGGDGQLGAPGQFLLRALSVEVREGSSGPVLANAPVSFTITTGGGEVALQASGTGGASVQTRTDHQGIARAWFRSGNQRGTSSTVQAQAGSATPVTFTVFTENEPDIRAAAWWPLDETEGTLAQDGSGNGHDAVVSGEGQPRYGTGVRHYALAFDGADTVLEADNAGYSIIPENGKFTLSFWFKLDEIKGAEGHLNALATNVTGELDGFRLAVASDGNGAGHLRFWSSESGGDIAISSNESIASGYWYHAAVAYDGVRVDLYINGVYDSGAVGTVHSNNGALLFGGGLTGGARMQGLLDELSIYPARLSGAAVLAAYRRDAPVPRLTTGTITASVGVPTTAPLTFSHLPTQATCVGLPSGLTFDAQTFTITGIPAAAGVSSVIIEAENPYGRASSVLTIVVSAGAPPPPVIDSPLSATAPLGASYVYRITAENYPTSYHASPLPPGLSLDVATGILSGTPSQAGTFSITLTASNTAGSVTATFLLHVQASSGNAPMITSPRTASAQVGAPFSYTITAEHSPTSYAAEGLPDGVVLDELTGVIAGVPTMGNMAHAFIVRATNGHGSASQVVELSIAAAESAITSALAINAVVNEPLIYQLEASNHPTSFLATGLPSWLTLDEVNWVLVGTPPEPTPPQTIPYQVIVPIAAANAVEDSPQTVPLTITVLGPRPTVTSSNEAHGMVGELFSYQIAASESPTTFSAEGLPEGLSLNSATGLISGTPTVSGSFFLWIGAENLSGEGETAALRITVREPGAPEITSPGKLYAIKGEPLTYQIEAVGNPTSYNASNLPSGLTYDVGTHTISGTIAQVSTPVVDLSATNAVGTGTAKLQIVVMADSGSVSAILRLRSGVHPRQAYRAFSAGISEDTNDPEVAARRLPGGGVGSSTEEVAYRTLLGFDISDLPADAEISSADLTLKGWSLNEIQVDLHSTGPFDPQTASWNHNATYDATVLSSLTVNSSTLASRVWESTQEFADAVDEAHLAQTPLYLMLVSESAEEADAIDLPQQLSLFMESASASQRPLLEIAYTTAAPPEIEVTSDVSGVNGKAFEFSVKALHAPTAFQASGLPAGLTINASTGVISGTPSVDGSFSVLLTASNDNGSGTALLPLKIHQSAPQITSSLTATVAARAPFSYTITATNSPTSFSATGLPSGLTMDSLTGAITGSVNNPGTYNITIRARNAGGTTSATLALTVGTIPPEITSAATASGNVGAYFSYGISAINGVTAYSATGLPPGLSRSGSTISGTPTQEGVYTVDIGATNTAGSDSATVEITIGPLRVPVVTSASRQAALGTSFSYSVVASHSPSSYQAVGLPPGITRSGGYLSGTPTQAGVFPVEVTATNQYGSGTGVIEITVSAGPAVTSASTAQGIRGSSFSYYLQTMGYGSITMTASGLPPGLGVVGSSIIGTPTQVGTYPATLSISNTHGTTLWPLTITVNSRPVITSGGVIAAQVGEPLTYNLAADYNPTSWEGVNMPAGLQVNAATGEITGTPTAAGQVISTIRMQNTFGLTQATLVFNIAAAEGDLQIDFQEQLSPTAVYTITTATIANDTTNPATGLQGTSNEPIASVGRTSTSVVKRMLLAFDLSLLPEEATITAAELGLFFPVNDFEAELLELRLHETLAFPAANPHWVSHSTSKTVELGRTSLEAAGAHVIHGTAAFAQAVQQTRASENPVLYLMLSAPAAETSLLASAGIVAHGDDPAQNPRLTLRYTAAAPSNPPVITSPLEMAVTVDEPMTYGITATNRPTQYTATGLPDGLVIDTQTGLITGEPELIGEFLVNLSATNSIGIGGAVLRLRVESVARADELVIVSGDRQSAPGGQFLEEPLVVRATRQSVPLAEALVTYSVPEGDGELALDDDLAPRHHRMSAVTDSNGLAEIYFKTPALNKRIIILAESGNAEPVRFLVSSTGESLGGDQMTLRVISGNAQTTGQGAPLPQPVVLEAIDANGLPIIGGAMDYEFIQGSGQITGDVVTDHRGRATLSATLSGQPGTIHRIRATLAEQAEAIIVATTASPGSGGGNPGGNPSGGDFPGETPAPGGSGARNMDGSAMLGVSNFSAEPYREYSEEYPYEEVDPSRVILYWASSSVGAQGFIIDRRSSQTGWKQVAIVGPGATSYIDMGVKVGPRYTYRIRAFRDDEYSAPAHAVYKHTYIKALERQYHQTYASKGVWREYGQSGEKPKFYLRNTTQFEKSEQTSSSSWRGDYQSTLSYSPFFDSENNKIAYTGNYNGNSSYYYDSENRTEVAASMRHLDGEWDGHERIKEKNKPEVTNDWNYWEYQTGNHLNTSPTVQLYQNGSITLSDEYTTAQFVADAQSSLPPPGSWDRYDFSLAYYGHSRGEDWWFWTWFWDFSYDDEYGYYIPYEGVFIGSKKLSLDEVTYNQTVARYRFHLFPSLENEMQLLEVFSPSDNISTPENESLNVLLHKKRTIVLEGEYSREITVDPRDRNEDGVYFLAPITKLDTDYTQGYSADDYEKKHGISLNKLENSEASMNFYFTSTGLPNSTYSISWTNSAKFKVYAASHTGWMEIESGQLWTGKQLFDLGITFFKIVAIDSLDENARTTLSLTTASNGQHLHTSTANFFYEPPTGSFAMPLDEASGARYRKIGLNGVPLPDGKPQQTDESGQEPEETFIDALTLGLRHSTTDIYLPIPGSDFALSARRDYQSEVWNLRNGLRPQEDLTKPFGVCWSSNLVPNVKIVQNANEPTKAYVTDESGAVHSFIVWSKNSKTHFFPMPTARHQQTPNLSSLTLDSSATKPHYVFKKKYGATLTFEAATTQTFPSNRYNTVGEGTSYSYARLKTAVDRLRYTVYFNYENATNLIPKTITVQDHPDLTISILQDAGLITKIWDAKGYVTTFEYETQTYTDIHNVSPIKKLARVIHPDGSVTRYSYTIAEEVGKEPLPPESPQARYWHCDLAAITDPLNRTYQFDYDGGSNTPVFDRSKLDYKKDEFFTGYFEQSGLPRNVRNVLLPNGEESEFINDSCVWITKDDVTKRFRAEGQRRTRVTDVSGLTRIYDFDDAEVIPLPEIKKNTPSATLNFREPKIVVYQQMHVTHGGFGAETFEFDITASMALKRSTDLSGNTTTFAYQDPWYASESFQEILGGSSAYSFHSDPTRQTNALGGVKTFTYTPVSRLMDSITDEAGRITTYAMDSRGRRTKETISGDGVTQVTTFSYDNSRHPGFITRKEVQKQAGDQSPTSSLVTTYLPDANGNIASETVAPGALNLTTRHTYDANGNRQTTTDPLGNVTTFSYDKRNRLTAISYPDGGTKYLVYDARGNKIKEYDENGRVTLLEYDTMNRVTQQVRDMNGNGQNDGRGTDLVTSFTYNAAGAKLTETDPRGATTTYQYDLLQRQTRAQDAAGNTTTFEYGANSGGSAFDSTAFKPTRTVAPRGVVTTITYDALYRPTLTTVTSPATPVLTTSVRYDAVGNPIVATDGLNRQTRTAYDGLNRPTRITHADGTYTETSYSSTGLSWKSRDELDRETVTEYDAAGRPTLVRMPAVDSGNGTPATPETRSIYDAAGNTLATVNPRGHRWDYLYDARNRKIRESQPSVYDFDAETTQRPAITTQYDAVGNVIAVTDPLGNTVNTVYDAANRPTVVHGPEVPVFGGNPERPQTSTTYDANGNIITTTNPNGQTTTNTYDSLNRLLSTTDAAGITVHNQYDAAGNRISVIDGMGRQTRFEYDGLNRNTKNIDPAGQATTFRYDAINKIQRIDAIGKVTSYSYDLRDRLRNVIYANAPPLTPETQSFTYDTVGNLLSVRGSNPNQSDHVDYAYDALNRTIAETSSGVTHQYRYDLAGNRIKTVYGGTNRELLSTYDALNRLASINDDSLLTRYYYDRKGNNRLLELPNEDQIEREFDALSRFTSISSTNSNSNTAYEFYYQYDLLGNVVEVAEEFWGSEIYYSRGLLNEYDEINRLISEEIWGVDLDDPNGWETLTLYEYDDAHNRISKTVDLAPTSYTYNSLNQLTEFDDGSVVTSYTYDANGNRTSRIKGSDHDLYSYDGENRLLELQRTKPSSSERYVYEYDHRHRRVVRGEIVGTQETWHQIVFSGGTSVQEIPFSSNTPDVEYVRGSDYGGGIGGILYSVRNGEASFTHANHRGDVILKRDEDGITTYEAHYEAFGSRTAEAGSTNDRQKANSKEEDPTGLLNEGFRYRDLETGTFITRDPLGFVDGPNLYAYVMQNPWTKFDPLGLWQKEAIDVARFVGPAAAPVVIATAPAWGPAAVMGTAVGVAGYVVYDASRGPQWTRVEGGGLQVAPIVKNQGISSLKRHQSGYALPAETTLEQQQQYDRDRQSIPAAADANLNNTVAESRGNKSPSGSAKKVQRTTEEAVDNAAKAENGTIYKVPGTATPSGKPYIGRHNKPEPQKTRASTDGRDRTQAEVIDTYDTSKPMEGRVKEQAAIDAEGGVSNLDNKRNEIRKKK